MPFQNHLQFDKQWDFMIPIILCTFLGLAAHIDLLTRVTIFWNLPNRNFNTFIAQLTFTSHDESWENLFIDIHIDRERSNRANPTPGRSPCQTRIGIGATWHISRAAIGLILESEVTVIVDQYQCVNSACIMPYIHASFIRKCMYLFTSLY